jgi:hypothetical protein
VAYLRFSPEFPGGYEVTHHDLEREEVRAWRREV